MLKILMARLKQKHRTMAYPKSEPVLSDRYRGRCAIDRSKCPPQCRHCVERCPTGALTIVDGQVCHDAGRCLFCMDCLDACPNQAIQFTQDYRLAVRQRKDLLSTDSTVKLAAPLEPARLKLLSKSLKLRQVSAGGCNACEADVNVLSTLAFDLGRFGIQFVASPRHADGLLITGPVSQNMRQGLLKTYEATPEPRVVIVVGSCAIAGGPYIDHAEACNGADTLIPVDLYVPGCPPHPMTILDGLLRLLGRI